MGKEALITKIERLNYEKVKEIKTDSQQVQIYWMGDLVLFQLPLRENIASGALTYMDMDIRTLFWQGKSAFPIVYQPAGILACR